MNGNVVRLVWLTALALLFLALPDRTAAQVRVDSTSPNAAPQGTTSLDVTMNGNDFKKGAVAKWFVSGTINPGGVTVNSTTFKTSTQIGAVHPYTAPLASSQQPSYVFQPPSLVSTSGLAFGYGVGLAPGYPFLRVGDHLQSVGSTSVAGQIYVYKKN